MLINYSIDLFLVYMWQNVSFSVSWKFLIDHYCKDEDILKVESLKYPRVKHNITFMLLHSILITYSKMIERWHVSKDRLVRYPKTINNSWIFWTSNTHRCPYKYPLSIRSFYFFEFKISSFRLQVQVDDEKKEQKTLNILSNN